MDQVYHSKVVKLQDPVEILKLLEEIKRCECNESSVTIRKKLYSLQYSPGKEKASEFWDRFEEVVSNYENLPDSTTLSEEEKRDAFYNAIMINVPEVQSVDFMTKNNTGRGLTYEHLKKFTMQAEASSTPSNVAAAALNVHQRPAGTEMFSLW